MALRGELAKLTREEYELSGLQAKELLESGKFAVSDLREKFDVYVDEIHEVNPNVYDMKKLVENGFLTIDFVKRFKGNSFHSNIFKRSPYCSN